MVSSPPLVLTQFDGTSTMNSIMRDGGYSLVTNIVEIKTKGDKIQDRHLDRSIDKAFFVKEIQDS